jgi:hypothetical protein
LGEEISGLDVGELIVALFAQDLKISGEGCGFATDVDDLSWLHVSQGIEDSSIASGSRWI